jgi:enoyl-[acyl-carrier-protein] reductase (NADH)
MPAVEALVEELRVLGPGARFFNVNAAAESGRTSVTQALVEAGIEVDVLMHSLAFGTLLDLVPTEDGDRVVSARQLEMTLDVMAHSLVYWTQDLLAADRLADGGRIFAMTSSGSQRSLPQYGPVSAAKAALEAHIRQLARELAPRRITANAIMAGVTDTPALRKIPGHEGLLTRAAANNPYGRLTRPEDVADALVALAAPGTRWMTGNVIRVDGGEDFTA